jgi:carbohydrate-selective porin OprB
VVGDLHVHQCIKEIRSLDGARSGWGVFGTFTAAGDTTNPISRFVVVGLGDGPFSKRPSDTFGIAYASVGVSKKFRTAVASLLRAHDEHAAEAFYTFSLTTLADANWRSSNNRSRY